MYRIIFFSFLFFYIQPLPTPNSFSQPSPTPLHLIVEIFSSKTERSFFRNFSFPGYCSAVHTPESYLPPSLHLGGDHAPCVTSHEYAVLQPEPQLTTTTTTTTTSTSSSAAMAASAGDGSSGAFGAGGAPLPSRQPLGTTIASGPANPLKGFSVPGPPSQNVLGNPVPKHLGRQKKKKFTC